MYIETERVIVLQVKLGEYFDGWVKILSLGQNQASYIGIFPQPKTW